MEKNNNYYECEDRFEINKNGVRDKVLGILYISQKTFMEDVKCDTCEYVCAILQAFPQIEQNIRDQQEFQTNLEKQHHIENNLLKHFNERNTRTRKTNRRPR